MAGIAIYTHIPININMLTALMTLRLAHLIETKSSNFITNSIAFS